MTRRFDDLPLMGRHDELARIDQLMTGGPARLVTLTGRGGIGKTRLAREYACSGQHPTGRRITFVSLAGIRRDALTMAHIGTALGLPPSSTQEPADAVIAHLGSDDHLLVLDNLEHLPGAAREVGRLLDRCPDVRILATSQAPMRLRAEHVLRIPPLPTPNDATLDLDEHPAIELYLAAARLAADGFQLAPDEHAAVAELCARLEGLPLAIELAGARAATLRPRDVARCLDEIGTGVLRRERHDAPERHHDIVAAIGWTHDLLSPSERDLLAVLASGTGAFGVEVVMAVPGRRPGDNLDALTALVDLHLVEQTSDRGRIACSIPASIRDVALARAADEHALDADRRRYVAAFASVAGAAADDLERGASSNVFPSKPGDGLADALELALDNGQLSEALDLVRVLADRWDNWGYDPFHESLVERCLAESADLVDHADIVRRGRVGVWSAIIGLRHRSTRSEAELIDRLRWADQLDDDHTRMFAAVGFVLAAPITGYLAAASTAIDAALDRARLPRNAGWLPMTQIWAGMVAARQGDADRAVDLGLAALRAGRRAADDSVVLLSVLLLGPFVTRRPELDRELPTGAEAVELARRCHQPLNEALLLIRLVTRSVVEGDHRQALERAEEMLLLGRAMHGSPAVAFQLLVTQWVVTLAGDVDRAACLFGAVRPTLGFINTYEMPAQRTAREERIDQLRSTLGDEAFESLAARGAAMAPAEAMEFALDAVRDALATLTADHDEQTAVTSRQCDGNSIVLTARQRQILQLLALGLSNKAIAAELRISVKTVMHHTTAIYRKLGVSSRQEAVVHAYRTGMVRAETA